MKLFLATLLVATLSGLYLTNPMNIDPACKGQSVPKHCMG